MDDFLHNLRTGKLKTRSKKNGRSVGGNQRKTAYSVDRRGGGCKNETPGREHQASMAICEALPEIKKMLSAIAKSQQQLLQVQENQIKMEERKISAMESIAVLLKERV